MSSKIPKLKFSTHVPLEIELEIVKRLPVKSLIRFISVCKAWKSMIECYEFVAGYKVLPTQPQHLMIRYEDGYRQQTEEVKFVCYVDDDDTFPRQKIAPTVSPILQLLGQSKIIDSSCGLLCLDGYLQEPDNSYTEMYVLWNPSIRKSIAVVAPNPVSSPLNYVTGFGVCPYTNDPKLVKVTYIDDCYKSESTSCIPMQVVVFTLSYGGWKVLSCSNLPRKSIQFLCSQATISQFIYWLAEDDEDFRDRRSMIMSFDMSTEEFKEVDLPDSLANLEAGPSLSISRLKESLALVEYHEVFPAKGVCTVWVMEHGDSKAFTKLFTINASVGPTLGFRKSGEPIIELQHDIWGPTSLAVYEPCLEHIKDLGICGDRYSFSACSYTESLLLLDHDDGCIIRHGVEKV